MENSKFEWMDFYKAFSFKLLEYERDRKVLLEKLQKVYNELGLRFQKLERDDSVIDIDPFTVYGLFNKSIKETNRIAIIEAFAKEFGISDVKIPTAFWGIPTLNPLMAVFFGWTRNNDDIDNLWKLFGAAIAYADGGNNALDQKAFTEIYDKVIKQSCVKWNITMGLFWVRPNIFLNLDSRSRWYIENYCSELINGNKKALKNVLRGERYLELCKAANVMAESGRYPFGNIPELSYAAWEESERVNQQTKTMRNVLRESETVENNTAVVNMADARAQIAPPYGVEDFLSEVYMSEEDYNVLVDLVSEKKNVILQGAPGVGKTYAAVRLAYSIMGVKDEERVAVVQFHQSYSYEDFIIGYRPTQSGGFKLEKGPFYDFCKRAESDAENDYFFIIDEINRGNLSKIFGELFMLIEADKRSECKLKLLYSNEEFSVPSNVYIIGMMNTADRSLAMLDYALRRRFVFFDMQPGFDSDGFNEYRASLNSAKFNLLVDNVKTLNKVIEADASLGEGFRIGHSYFCNVKDDGQLSKIVEYELIPLLKEYWFDEPAKVKEWSNVLRSVIR